MHSQKIGAIVVLHLFFLALLVSQAMAQTDSEMQAIIKGAKKEGEVVFYGSISTSEATPLLKAFEKKYPFLKTKHQRAGSDTLMEKILIETQAGRYAADVFNLRAFTTSVLVKKGLFAKFPSRQDKFYPEGFKDPEGYWTSFYMNPATFGYNTRLVSPADAPKKWADLLQPRWKGQMVMDREESEWYANMLKVMGPEKGRQFMKKLAAQDIVFRTGHTLQAQLVAAGEFKIGVVLYTPRIEQMRSKGAPIDWARADPVIAYHYSLGVASHAPHPNAARLFVDFFLSREGQELLVKVGGRVPVRSDVKPKPAYLVEGVNLVPSDPALAEKDFKKYFDEYREVFDVP
jgi:iron(III) transport system substrate-binding protein